MAHANAANCDSEAFTAILHVEERLQGDKVVCPDIIDGEVTQKTDGDIVVFFVFLLEYRLTRYYEAGFRQLGAVRLVQCFWLYI